jgi:hypothetical protein
MIVLEVHQPALVSLFDCTLTLRPDSRKVIDRVCRVCDKEIRKRLEAFELQSDRYIDRGVIVSDSQKGQKIASSFNKL